MMVFQGCHTCLDGMYQALTDILAALKRNPDNDTPRPPPPSATTLDFPCCEPKSTETSVCIPHDLTKLFGGIQKGPTTEHFNALNISLDSNLPLEELAPVEHLPPKLWLNAPDPSTDSTKKPILINGGSLPAQETFYTRAKELQISNENGYRTIHRVPLAKHEGPIRLLFFRKFWEELDCMADYWDTSQDKYVNSLSGSRKGSDNATLDVDQLRGMAQPWSDVSEQERQRISNGEMQNAQISQKSNNVLPNDAPNVSNQGDTPMTDAPPTEESSTKPSQPITDSTLYTGHRTSTGSLMPPHHLERTLFSFLDPLALPFRLRLIEPKSQPRLQFGSLLLPLPHMACIHRVPLDQASARQGWREGPLMGAVAAEYAVWREDGERPGQGRKERLQLLKEVGCVLLLAQRRAREGKEEVVPGKGKWWAEVPRWGGASGVATFKEPGGGDGQAKTGEGKPSLIEAQRRRVKRARRGGEERKENDLIPPSSLWERNVRYARIGMEKVDGTGEIDDIYLVSGVNHHLSIVHAKVHTRYIEHITSGGNPGEQREEWWELSMQRSKWFDLLDSSDRVEAMRGVWAVMSWMMREAEE